MARPLAPECGRPSGKRGPCIALLLAVFAVALPAQTVRWDPPGGQLGFNQVTELALVFEECEPTSGTTVPTVDNLVFGRPAQSSQTSMTNFKVSRTFSLVYPVRPTARTSITIPSFEVETDKGRIRVKAATYTVGDATVGNTGMSINDIAEADLTVPKNTFWAGEVFPVTYTMNVVRRYFHSPASLLEWQAAPLVAEEWSKPEPSETMIRGERRLIATQTTRAYAKQPGSITMKPASQLVNLQVGQSGFGPFAQSYLEQRVLASDPLTLTIRPLPAAPAEFSGAVGQFTLSSKIVPTAPTVGEPVTWTLELSGVGNWPDIAGLPAREVSSDFSVVQPKSKRTMKDNSLFEGTLTEDVVLVPTKPGKYTLGPVRVTYFDTNSGTYKTLSSEVVTVTVGAGAAAPVPSTASTGPVQFSLPEWSASKAAELPTAVAPVPPENLPRDPLGRPAFGIAPRSVRSVALTAGIIATAIPLAVWLWLAAARSRALDPERRRRAALAALSRILADLRSGKGDRTALLQEWQRETAVLWRVRHAAPGAPLVESMVARELRDAAPAWAALWSEADRAQHARNGTLPNDWTLRAEAALQAVRVPGWSPASLFAPRHLLPFTAALAVLLMAVSARGAAPEDYRAGKFPQAEAEWRKQLQSAPNDWATRHNLGLALAQQDKWAEAAAQWTSAFVLNARSEQTRYDLALGLQRSGMAPPELVEFSRGEGVHRLARLASPGEWQAGLLVASLLLALALSLLLLRAYGRIGTWSRAVAISAVFLGILLAAAATLSLRTYGVLANPDAIIVHQASVLRSVPTEADTQKTTALSAGSLAVVDRTFLGWSRLSFPGGQSGWARTETLVRLYR